VSQLNPTKIKFEVSARSQWQDRRLVNFGDPIVRWFWFHVAGFMSTVCQTDAFEAIQRIEAVLGIELKTFVCEGHRTLDAVLF
jgi:hypothetical protein